AARIDPLGRRPQHGPDTAHRVIRLVALYGRPYPLARQRAFDEESLALAQGDAARPPVQGLDVQLDRVGHGFRGPPVDGPPLREDRVRSPEVMACAAKFMAATAPSDRCRPAWGCPPAPWRSRVRCAACAAHAPRPPPPPPPGREHKGARRARHARPRSEEHTSELQSRENLVCRLLLEKKK